METELRQHKGMADLSSFSVSDYTKHVLSIFKELREKGINYETSLHINALVNVDNPSNLFNERHASWIYKNHTKAFDLLTNDKARKLFQLLAAGEGQASHNKSINKLRKEIKTSPANMWYILGKFRELVLIVESEAGKGDPKYIRLNSDGLEVIIKVLSIMLIQL